ncbi:glycosyltransferase family 4 protein [Amylibacter sp.]|nr:glycosyltransferase family 4 protein [Amylibacter sp.]
MNILCVSKYAAPPKYSKMPARLFELASEFNRIGHSTNLITSDSNHLANFPILKKKYSDELIDGVEVRWFNTLKYKKTGSIARVLSWFHFEIQLFFMPTKRFLKPDVILISSLSIFSILYGYYLKKKFNAFLIFEIRDIWPLTLTEEGGFPKWHPLVCLMGIVEKFGYKKADLIVGTMPKLDLHVEKIIGHQKPFHCSPIGFNPDNYNHTKISTNLEESLKLSIPKGRVVIGYAGSMGLTNSLEMFIDVIESFKNDASVYFLLVGSGDQKKYYEEQLVECDNVLFLPRVAQKEVNSILKLCDVLYLSTKDSEVWKYGQSMNKVVEYMLASKPIIASYSGYPSMINEANCGFFVDQSSMLNLKNAISKMIKFNNVDRKIMGKNGRNWIYSNRKYSILAKDYADAITLLMAQADF